MDIAFLILVMIACTVIYKILTHWTKYLILSFAMALSLALVRNGDFTKWVLAPFHLFNSIISAVY